MLRGPAIAALAVAAVAALAAPGAARADDDDESDHGLFERPRWKRVTITGGGIDGLGGGLGGTIAIGRKATSSFHLAAEYTVLHLWNSEEDASGALVTSPTQGVYHRLGLTATFPITEWLTRDESMEVAFWLEAGAGALRVPGFSWQPDLVVGWVAEPRGTFDRGKDSGFGLWLGARIYVSRHDPSIPDDIAVPEIAGASQAPILDVGLMSTFGVRWGS